MARTLDHRPRRPPHDAVVSAAALVAALVLAIPACGRGRPAAAQERPATAARPGAGRTISVEQARRRIWGAGARATFAATTDAERAAIARLVPALVAAAMEGAPCDPDAWRPLAAAAGLELEVWEVAGATIWALVEPADRPRGAGAYLFRVGRDPAPASAILLQAPHAYHDLGTGALALRLFLEPAPTARPRALFTNTIHRYQETPGRRARRPGHPADVAHNPSHLFTRATEAFADGAAGAIVFQLHGFADPPSAPALDARPPPERRTGAPTAGGRPTGERAGTASRDETVEPEEHEVPPPPGTRVVVSAGTRRGSTPRTTAIAAALRALMGDGVRRYPEECAVLGGTTNEQARALRARPGSEFVHVELAASVRRALRGDAALRAGLGRALFAPPPPTPPPAAADPSSPPPAGATPG